MGKSYQYFKAGNFTNCIDIIKAAIESRFLCKGFSGFVRHELGMKQVENNLCGLLSKV